jgi:hypothetical protein
MMFEDFQSACHNFAGFSWQHQARHLLVDTHNFTCPLPSEFPVWREKELNPRYHALGVLKFAYLIHPDGLPALKDLREENGTFETRYFGDFSAALQWLTEAP